MHGHGFAVTGALLTAAVAGAFSLAPSHFRVGGAQGASDGEYQPPAGPDSAFAALQLRGEQVMGVNQYTSTHIFDELPNGGRIELQRDVDDSAGVEQIRRHLRHIADAFASGDFTTPAFVHLREVPGAGVMAAKSDEIEYFYRDLPRGGEVRMITRDPDALRAIGEFMAYQREQHRSTGVDVSDSARRELHHRMMQHHHLRSGGAHHDSVGARPHETVPHDSAGRPAHRQHGRGGDSH